MFLQFLPELGRFIQERAKDFEPELKVKVSARGFSCSLRDDRHDDPAPLISGSSRPSAPELWCSGGSCVWCV
jgi:hypothetical protein